MLCRKEKKVYLQLFVGGLMTYLHYLCLFTYSNVQYILCCVFVLSFLRLVCPMFQVSLDCSFVIAPSVYSNVYSIDSEDQQYRIAERQ